MGGPSVAFLGGGPSQAGIPGSTVGVCSDVLGSCWGLFESVMRGSHLPVFSACFGRLRATEATQPNRSVGSGYTIEQSLSAGPELKHRARIDVRLRDP